MSAPASNSRRRIHLQGIVQGVGFRPAVWRLATELGLAGFVVNRSDGVVIEIEGAGERLEEFSRRLAGALPAAAVIGNRREEELAPCGETEQEKGFAIVASRPAESYDFSVGPDLALCPACRAELRDPADRRYRYPFINCTGCGPRLTIVEKLPYDRVNTTMAAFPLCRRCRKEYEAPADRRFHAEAIACPECGPRLELVGPQGKRLALREEALDGAIAALRRGEIVAVKGLGGFHLAVRADDQTAVARLRQRKQRPAKPFALMARDLATAERIAFFNEPARRLFASPRAPIQLLSRRPGSESRIAPAVAPGLDQLGILPPYTPLHQLLLDAAGLELLVMTSGNLSEEPLAVANREALARLAGIADLFLLHDREIKVRLDDSIVSRFPGGLPLPGAGQPPVDGHSSAPGRATLLRRSRGYVPESLELLSSSPGVLGLGGELKNAPCLTWERKALFAPHVGDLGTPGARDFFHENLALLLKLAGRRPRIVACDLHPGYYTSRAAAAIARETGAERVVAVQHHHAHIVACMAEHGLSGPVIGMACDGTGWGPDGTIWGGEILLANEKSYHRLARLRPFPLPGGEAAIREPWRIALGLLEETFPDDWYDCAERLGLLPAGWRRERLELLLKQRLNAPLTSSLGRLFDALAALLCFGSRPVTYEGQAAIELEALAGRAATGKNPESMNISARMKDFTTRLQAAAPTSPALRELDFRPLFAALAERRLKTGSRSAPGLAAAAHEVIAHRLARTAADLAAREGLQHIILSGGCFQNRRLFSGFLERPGGAAATESGLKIHTHVRVPPNDGGLALGQAVIAAARSRSAENP